MSVLTQKRYLQLAFNHNTFQVDRVLPQIPYDPRIIIEAGTPYIKREGVQGIQRIKRFWRGHVVADLKVTDGAVGEIQFARGAGATIATAMGSAPIETLKFFIDYCRKNKVLSAIDMLGVDNPLRKLLPVTSKPDIVVIHKGRDEESNKQRIIRYKDIVKIRSKYEAMIAVAGGLEPENIRKAYFNGADVAILNITRKGDPNIGLIDSTDFRSAIPKLLQQIGN